MKLKDFIAKLEKYDSDLTVHLADWNEQYADPNEEVAELVIISGNSLIIGADSEDSDWRP